jgi:hypothetical protein
MVTSVTSEGDIWCSGDEACSSVRTYVQYLSQRATSIAQSMKLLPQKRVRSVTYRVTPVAHTMTSVAHMVTFVVQLVKTEKAHNSCVKPIGV